MNNFKDKKDMVIRMKTDNRKKPNETFIAPLERMIDFGIRRFSSRITRLDVFLSDEEEILEIQEDKRCMLEARIKGFKPVAVTDQADTHERAVNGATEKLIASLKKMFDKKSTQS